MNERHPMPDVDLNPHDWEEVKHILMTHVPEYDVWAFGSRVTWTAKAYSDLDLAIITEKPLSLSDLAKLKEAFDESTISIKIDVVDWASTSGSFRKVIEKKRVLLQKSVSTKSGWIVEKLIDCTYDGNLSYGIVQPGQHDPNGIPIARVNIFKNGQLQIDDVLKVSPEIENKYKRTRLVGSEVLLTLVGSTGQSAVVPKEMSGWNIARAVAVIRPKKEIGADWINICLQTKEVQRFLDERANTTVQKTLNLADVREIPIPIPPKAVKDRIEAIAMALTNKIELNRQINQTLEQIAQTIFKSWFVDFEPVKAKIEAKAAGRDPERAAMCAISGKFDPELDQLPPEQRQQLAVTAAHFPDELVESELGLIPLGWEVGAIGQEVLVVGGSTPSTANPEFWDGEFAWVTPKDLSGQSEKVLIGSVRKITAAGVGKISSGQLPVGTVLLSSRAPIGYLALSMVPVSINQGFIAMRCDKRLPNTYVLQWTTNNLDAIKQRGSGTTFAEISKSNFRPMTVLVPDVATLSGFQQLVMPLYEQITINSREVESLATLRDTLLPKLLSGELSADECERETISGG